MIDSPYIHFHTATGIFSMTLSRLFVLSLIPLIFAACKKEPEPEFSADALHGVWLSSASGEDANGDRVFDPEERVEDKGNYEWTFRTDDTLIIKSRISSTAPLIREWYRVEGSRFYRASQNGGSAEIIRLGGGRFLTRTEMPAGFNASWLELRRQ